MRETNVQMMIQDFQENVSVEGLIQVCGVCTCEPPQVAHLQLSLHFLCLTLQSLRRRTGSEYGRLSISLNSVLPCLCRQHKTFSPLSFLLIVKRVVVGS